MRPPGANVQVRCRLVCLVLRPSGVSFINYKPRSPRDRRRYARQSIHDRASDMANKTARLLDDDDVAVICDRVSCNLYRMLAAQHGRIASDAPSYTLKSDEISDDFA